MKNSTNMIQYAPTGQLNRLWQEAENQQGDRLTIEHQSFCCLKEIELKTMKML